MNVPDRDHPIWVIGIMAMILLAGGLMLAFHYNRFDSRDVDTLFAIGVAYLASVVAKRKLLGIPPLVKWKT